MARVFYNPSETTGKGFVTDYYIYALQNPFNGDIFYVGLTCYKPEVRFKAHLSESISTKQTHKNKDKNEAIRQILKESKLPILHILESFFCKDCWDIINAHQKEADWLNLFTEMGYNLTNKKGRMILYNS